MLRSKTERKGLWRIAATLIALLASQACLAAHVDPAPLPADMANRFMPSTPPDGFFPSFEHALDEAATLIENMQTEQQKLAGQGASSAPGLSLVAAKRHELNSYRNEIMRRLDAQDARMRALGGKPSAALRAQIDARFKRLTDALDAMATPDAAARLAAMRNARQVMHDLVQAPREARIGPLDPEAPTWTQRAPLPSRDEPKSEARPQYLSYEHAPGNNVYAFLGDTLLAALPAAVPPQATTCNYAAADLASTQDASITPEIQNLAASLNYSPVKIFQYVSNNIKYQPYYGSLKGSTGVLYSGAGGPTDQASFLIALLRASNIPARYVRGVIQVLDAAPAADGGRIGRWVGAKSYNGAVGILGQGNMPTYGSVTNSSSQVIGVFVSHVWVEACVPYAHYRGTASDNAGFRWIPLDPSFKDQTYQAGIATSVNFDYTGFLAKRSNTLPHEWFAGQVSSYIKGVGPNFGNNTLQDVPYQGTQVPLGVDVLPASLPYELNQFTNWSNTASPETADLPDSHRYKFNIAVNNSTGAALAPSVTLSLPQTALQRVTLSFQGATGVDQAALASWQNDGSTSSAIPCSINVVPVIKLDGVTQATGATAVGLCTTDNQLNMSVSLAELSTPTVNSVAYTNIGGANYHALQAYSFQASDRLLAERAKKLLTSVNANPNPNANLEETEGEYLHIVGLKYMRYISDGAKTIGGLSGSSGESGNHIGLTSTAMKVRYVFDLPFAVDNDSLLVDVRGGQSRDVDLSSGKGGFQTFLLAGYTASDYESYLWQENAQRDAVSTVRGLQYANESGIAVLNITAANAATQLPLLTSNSNAALNYPAGYVTQIQTAVNNGYTVNAPRSMLQFPSWTGPVWEQEKNDTVAGTMSAGFIIAKYAGGYALPTVPVTSLFNFGGTIGSYDPGIPQTQINLTSALDSFVNSTNAAAGLNPATATGGDPVNVLTGNLIHTERDLAIKGRGGLPLLFERNYNSRLPADGPLGYGWTHSFNHQLKFYGVENGLVKLSWVDGSGGEKFFSSAPVSGGVGINTTLTNAAGIYVTFQRTADGSYTLREKNGLTYRFESNSGATAGQTARLLSITDRNGNSLALSYAASSGCAGGTLLCSVTDGLNRSLNFSYSGNHLTQLQDFSGRVYQYGFDANGNLTSFKNPLAAAGSQNPVSYAYYTLADGQNLNHAMKSYTLPRGNGMNFEYYANGKVFRHTTTLGETNTFTYNTYRLETVQTNERGYSRRFLFNANGDVAQIIEENGAIRAYTYDTGTPANVHNRVSKLDPEGYLTQYQYDGAGNVTQIVNPSSATVAYYDFNSFNQPQRMKDARGNWSVMQYDANGNLTNRIALKAGVTPVIPYTPVASQIVAWTVMAYDSYGNLSSSRQVRDLSGQVANAASFTGPTRQFAYDAQYLNMTGVTRYGDKNGDGVIDATENDVSPNLSYDSLGRIQSGIDADWQITQRVYDTVDRVIQATDVLGYLRDYQFDANGNPILQRLDRNANLADSGSATFDQSDRKQSSVDAGGNVTQYQYDAAGNLITLTSPDNYTLGFVYDPDNRVIKAFDQEGNSVANTLDLSGKPRRTTDPNGNSTGYVYYDGTRDGRLKQTIDPANRATTLDYDNNGNIVSVTDNLNRTTLTQYDELNRPVRIVGPQYSDAALGSIRPVTSFTYDALGNRIQVKAGYTTDTSGAGTAADVLTTQLTQVFDDFGRKLKETDALNKTNTWQYDINNNVTSATDAKNQTTQYTWDYGHQLKTLKDQNGNLYSYTRNSLGQPTQVAAPGITYSYRYDASHRLSQVADSRGNKSLNYAYSPGGLLNYMIDSDGNRTDYLYDPVGRLAGIWAPNYDYTGFRYDAGGRLLEKWFPNGVDSQFNWNADNTLASLTNKVGGTTLSNHVYAYDGVGNRSSQAETVNGSTINYAYQYDNLNRLTQVTNGTATQQENYAYDPLGNRTAKTINATTPSTIAYVYDAANQLKEIHQGSIAGTLLTAFVYDVNGSLTSKCEGSGVTTNGVTCTGSNITSLSYDALNRMIQAAKTGQLSQSYAYDDSGRRIAKTIGATQTNFLYGGPDIVAEYTATWGLPTAQYTHGPNQDEPIERITQTGAQYFHHDGLGSVVAVSNNLGGTDATQRFDAWGNQIASTGTQSRYGYTGREPDETGLIYYRARYYDPSIGRFTQRDPMGLAAGINQYAYVNNNPTDMIDPSGLLPKINLANSTSYNSNPIQAFLAGRQNLGRVASSAAPQEESLGGVGDSLLDYAPIPAAALGKLGAGVLGAIIKGVEKNAGEAVVKGIGKADETVDLFRAVGVREFESINANKAFLPGGNSLEGRQFAFTLEEALKFADSDLSKVAIFKATIDKKALQAFDFSKNIDPFIFKNGVITIQPGAQSQIFHDALISISHDF